MTRDVDAETADRDDAAAEAIELASALLVAARAEPGVVPEPLRRGLGSIGADAEAEDGLLGELREAQLLQARLRRRATELEALFSTARELVRLQDVDEVLQRLVERAHQLMGTDVTYLSEFDSDSQELRVRHSQGTVTPEFRDLRVPAGFGLASMVARTRAPAWVARYDEMSEAPHDPRIDAAVRAEGLVSFLGVPLAIGDEVLGALFACNRFPHESSPDEVLLLSAFADHAASVLHSARALAEAAAAKDRAEHAYRELQQHVAATELAGVVHDELTGVVISGGTVIDVVRTLERSLGGRVIALNAQGLPLTMESTGAGEVPPQAALTAAIERSQCSGHVAEVRGPDGEWLITAILGADRVLGAIAASEPDRLPDAAARRTLERAAHVAALVSFKQEAVSAIRAERRARWLLSVVEGGGVDDSTLIAPPTRFTGCALIDLGAHGSGAAASVAQAAVAEDGLTAAVDRRILIAWTTPDVVAATERVRRVLADALRQPGLIAVASARDLLPGELAVVVERLTADLDFLPALGVSAATVPSESFAPYHALAPRDPQVLDGFIREMIGDVLEWDARRHTRLFDTLASYFSHGESRIAVAAAMHIHANTVQQRLDRIRTLLPGDLADTEFRFRVHAAVRLEQLRRTVRSPAG